MLFKGKNGKQDKHVTLYSGANDIGGQMNAQIIEQDLQKKGRRQMSKSGT